MAKLFEKWKLGSLELANRIIIAPMCQYSSVDGKASSWHLMHLGSLSHSGAGLLILEATAVTPEGRISWGDLGLYDDNCEIALRNVVQEIRKYSSMPLAIQLAHAGRKASTEKPWLPGGQIPFDQAHGWQTVAPSPLGYNRDDQTPQQLTVEDMEKICSAFVDSAQRAARTGFQGIEIHSAHGYLFHQFLSPLSNQRTDQYGGSLENRMRFPVDVFKAVRESLPASIAVWTRISATDWIEGGWTLEDSIVYSKELQKLGCAAIHVSSGGLDPRQKIAVGPHYQVSFSEKIKKATGLPTIAVGLITEAQGAEDILQKEQADAVALARAILYDPRWPWHAAAKLGASVLAPPQYLRSQPRGLSELLKPDT
jgi:2,4-dienoyl-CoA reductase-like NADH-dependent reductase (Old Yellow Enzyme family)